MRRSRRTPSSGRARCVVAPARRELVVATRAGNTTQLHRVETPGGPLTPLTDYAEPVRRGLYSPRSPTRWYSCAIPAATSRRACSASTPGAKEPVALTDADRRSDVVARDHARRTLLVASVALDRTGRQDAPTETITRLDPLNPESARVVATLPGTGWGDFFARKDNADFLFAAMTLFLQQTLHVG